MMGAKLIMRSKIGRGEKQIAMKVIFHLLKADSGRSGNPPTFFSQNFICSYYLYFRVLTFFFFGGGGVPDGE